MQLRLVSPRSIGKVKAFLRKTQISGKTQKGRNLGEIQNLRARERLGSIDHQEVFLLAGAIARHGAHRRTRTLLAGRTAHLLDRHTHAHAHAPAWPHLPHHYLPAPLAAPAADPQNHLLPPISPTHRSAVVGTYLFHLKCMCAKKRSNSHLEDATVMNNSDHW